MSDDERAIQHYLNALLQGVFNDDPAQEWSEYGNKPEFETWHTELNILLSSPNMTISYPEIIKEAIARFQQLKQTRLYKALNEEA